jgi:Co/Zn/Cd efflux system component
LEAVPELINPPDIDDGIPFIVIASIGVILNGSGMIVFYSKIKNTFLFVLGFLCLHFSFLLSYRKCTCSLTFSKQFTLSCSSWSLTGRWRRFAFLFFVVSVFDLIEFWVVFVCFVDHGHSHGGKDSNLFALFLHFIGDAISSTFIIYLFFIFIYLFIFLRHNCINNWNYHLRE